MSRGCKRPPGRPPTQWADVFVTTVCQLYSSFKRLTDHGTALALITTLLEDRHRGRRSRGKETNGRCAGARTTRDDGPSKY